MRLFLFISIILGPCMAFAQSVERQVIGMAGAYAEADGYSHSYTVGEVVTATVSDGTIILTQGFQQPNDMFVSIAEEDLQFNVVAFPNPTIDGVTLNLNADQPIDLRLDLFDAAGKSFVVNQGNFQVMGNTQREIDLAGFAPGTYFIRLTDETGRLNKTIRVQKVN